ncbi:uncharacterized protein LODBEIA_P29680 [Lodderomyces beijingensis]|uniref:separase n=1 Tax=Lodderomyces beijingensis TaxID=1775926 RepID=A0ABP0ZKS1_9ASCO
MDQLDRTLKCYLRAHSATPLSPKKDSNLPALDVKSLEAATIYSLQEQLALVNAGNGESSQSVQKYASSIQSKLEFLYMIYSKNQVNWLNTLKKHQVFIVRLFEGRHHDAIQTQLEYTFAHILKHLGLPVDKCDAISLLRGVPYVQCDAEVCQTISAFHFFILQWLVHSISKKGVPKDSGDDDGEGDDEKKISLLKHVPSAFLTKSNMRQWMAASGGGKDDKYTKNCIKLIKAFVKICNSLDNDDLQSTILCLKTRLLEFTSVQEDLSNLKVLPGITTKDNSDISNPARDEAVTSSSTDLVAGGADIFSKLDVNIVLINDDTFIAQFTDIAWNFKTVGQFIQTFRKSIDSISLTKLHLTILDHITIYANDNLSPSLVPSLKQLFTIFESFNQRKRMRNVSNLLFSLGKKTQDIDLMESAIEYEFAIIKKDPTSTNFEYFLNKIKMVKHVNKAIFTSLLKACQVHPGYQLHIQQICLLIMTNLHVLAFINDIEQGFKKKFVYGIFRHTKSQKGRDYLSLCNLMSKTFDFVNAESNVDPDMDMDTGSDLNMNHSIRLSLVDDKMYSSSPRSAFVEICHELTHGPTWEQTLLVKCFPTLQAWNPSNASQIEHDHALKTLTRLRHHGLSDYTFKLVQSWLAKNVKGQFKLQLCFEMCHACERLNLQTQWSEAITTIQQEIRSTKNIINLNEIAAYKIQQITLLIAGNSFGLAREKFAVLLKTIKSRPEYDIHSHSRNLPIVEKLQNFLALSRLQLVAAKLSQSPVDAYTSLKTSLQLVSSITKRCADYPTKGTVEDLQLDCAHLSFEIYNAAIENLIDLGLSQNIVIYLNEWSKSNDEVDLPIVNQVNRLKIGIYAHLSGSAQFQSHLDMVNEQVRNNKTVQDYLAVANLVTVATHDVAGLEKKNQQQQQQRFHDNDGQVFDDRKFRYLDIASTAAAKTCKNDLSQFKTMPDIDSCIEKLKDHKNNAKEPRYVSIFPAISEVTEVSTSPVPQDVFDSLVRHKDHLLKTLANRCLSVPERRKGTCCLSSGVHLMSLVGAYRGKELLQKVYFLEDELRTLPFRNQKEIYCAEEKGFIPKLPTQQKQTNDEFDLGYEEFKQDLKTNIPPRWKIVTLDVCDHTGDLLLSSYTRDKKPTYVRLSLTRFKEREGVSVFDFNSMKSEFNAILCDNRKSTKSSTTSQVKTIGDRKKWWKMRFILDNNLRELCQHVEKYWFGGFKGIFCERDGMLFTKFKEELVKILETSISKTINRGIVLTDFIYERFYSLVEYDRACVDDLLSYIISIISFHVEISLETIRFEKLHASIKQLIEKYASFQSADTSHVVLVPSSRCAFFPWESMDILRNKSVTRMPSVAHLLQALKCNAAITANDAYYLINPGGDLHNSENRFKPMVQKMPTWRGLVGTKPDPSRIIQDILDARLYLYIGHGGSDQYFKMSALMKQTRGSQKQHQSLPPSFLIGCSSGAIQDQGKLEPWGSIFSWLNCGSPLIFANLWDVTDKDIDALTITMMDQWGLFSIGQREPAHQRENIADAVARARSVCNLKYLNGAAPVLYGLPLPLSESS